MSEKWKLVQTEPDYLDGIESGCMIVTESGAPVAYGFRLEEMLLATCAPDLLSAAKRWAALDGGAWHAERHAQEYKELLAYTRALINALESETDNG